MSDDRDGIVAVEFRVDIVSLGYSFTRILHLIFILIPRSTILDIMQP